MFNDSDIKHDKAVTWQENVKRCRLFIAVTKTLVTRMTYCAQRRSLTLLT